MRARLVLLFIILALCLAPVQAGIDVLPLAGDLYAACWRGGTVEHIHCSVDDGLLNQIEALTGVPVQWTPSAGFDAEHMLMTPRWYLMLITDQRETVTYYISKGNLSGAYYVTYVRTFGIGPDGSWHTKGMMRLDGLTILDIMQGFTNEQRLLAGA